MQHEFDSEIGVVAQVGPPVGAGAGAGAGRRVTFVSSFIPAGVSLQLQAGTRHQRKLQASYEPACLVTVATCMCQQFDRSTALDII